MQENTLCSIRGVFPYLPLRLKELLQKMPTEQVSEIAELRLRANLPLLIVTASKKIFVTEGGRETVLMRDGLFTVWQSEIEETVARACGYSAHSHQADFKGGYLTLPGGHRVGLCGTAVTDTQTVTGVRAITALNIRIAKPIPHAADEVLKTCFQNQLQNILLVGPPMSGKTTVLRSLAQNLSVGNGGKILNCAVIDERGELFPDNAVSQTPCFADVLCGYPKAEGISLAVRALSPNIIFCDEIGCVRDVLAVTDGIRCGVRFVLTAHADSIEKLLARAYVKPLFSTGVLDTVLLLGTGAQVGKIKQVFKVGEAHVKTDGGFTDFCSLRADGNLPFHASA